MILSLPLSVRSLVGNQDVCIFSPDWSNGLLLQIKASLAGAVTSVCSLSQLYLSKAFRGCQESLQFCMGSLRFHTQDRACLQGEFIVMSNANAVASSLSFVTTEVAWVSV